MADLHEYEVPRRGRTMTVQMTAEDAKLIYGDQAKKVGPVEEAKPEPVTRPPYAVDDEDAEKAAAPRANKARSASNK